MEFNSIKIFLNCRIVLLPENVSLFILHSLEGTIDDCPPFQVVYTSTVPSTGDLYADASLFKQKASIVKAYASFGCTEPVFVELPRIARPSN
jgi:hypothetical protein